MSHADAHPDHEQDAHPDRASGHAHGGHSQDGHARGGQRGGQHGGHSHGAAGGDARWLSAALALILAFMAAEIVIGLAAHSLAVICDAAHMLTDAASIALVLITARLAARPPAGGYTWGLKRTEIMSAQANGITLVLLAAWLGYTAIRHLVAPPAVNGGTVLAVALVGVAVNVVATLLIARAGGGRGAPRSLNLAGA